MNDRPVFVPTLRPRLNKDLSQPVLTAIAIGAIGLMAVIVYLISVYLPGDKGRLSQAHNQIEKLLQENAALKSELEDAQSRLSNQQQAIETLTTETQAQRQVLSQISKLTRTNKGER